MSQIIKRFVGDNQIGAAKIQLENDAALAALNFASSEVDLLKLNASDVLEFLLLPQFGGSPLATQGYITTELGDYIPNSEKGANNGVATLDGGGKVPVSQLPNSVMEFQGQWNATTNSPALIDGTGNTGDVYRVNVAGTQDLGSGDIVFEVGDWVMYNGTIWQLSQNSVTGYAANDLSNLITTAVNANILPDTTNLRKLGDFSAQWNTVHTRLLDMQTAAGGGSIRMYNTAGQQHMGLAVSESTVTNVYGAGTAFAAARINNPHMGGAAANRSLILYTAEGGETGHVYLHTGPTATANTTGNIDLRTGNNTSTGGTGNIQLLVGTTTGTQGEIKFLKAGVPAVVSQVWTASNVDGSGYWATPAGGGATTALDNLAAVAINTSLISDTDNTDNLGSAALRWGSLYVHVIKDGSDNIVMDVSGHGLYNSSNAISLDFNTSGTLTSYASILPENDNSRTLGTSSLNWQKLFVRDIESNAGTMTIYAAVGPLVLDSDNNIQLTCGDENVRIQSYNNVVAPTLRMYDEGGINYVGIKSPTGLAGAYTLTLPVDDGAANEVLQTDGSGILSWVSLPSSATWSREEFTLLAGDITAGSIDLANAPINASIIMVVGGLVSLFNTDYTMSGVTLDFSGHTPALIAGDVVSVQYQY